MPRRIIDALANGFADQDFGGVLPGEGFQPTGDIDGIADGGELPTMTGADVSDDGVARVNADPDPERFIAGGFAGGVQFGKAIYH